MFSFCVTDFEERLSMGRPFHIYLSFKRIEARSKRHLSGILLSRLKLGISPLSF